MFTASTTPGLFKTMSTYMYYGLKIIQINAFLARKPILVIKLIHYYQMENNIKHYDVVRSYGNANY
mgnify:CR=1 FL=1